MNKLNYLILLIIITVSASLNANADAVSDINDLNEALTSKYVAGEIPGMIDLYKENAVMLPPSSEILVGTGAIEGYWENLKAIGVKVYTIYPVELNIEGNVAYATALWEAKRITGTGDVITMDGNLSNVYEKQENGNWKIKLQSWN